MEMTTAKERTRRAKKVARRSNSQTPNRHREGNRQPSKASSRKSKSHPLNNPKKLRSKRTTSPSSRRKRRER